MKELSETPTGIPADMKSSDDFKTYTVNDIMNMSMHMSRDGAELTKDTAK